MAKMRPCSVCGEPKWVTAKSRPEIVCQPCRAERRPTVRDQSGRRIPCDNCGEPCWPSSTKHRAFDGRTMCRACRLARGELGRRPSGERGPRVKRVFPGLCAWCEQPFEGVRRTARYCSLACSGKADSARRRAKREAVTGHSRRVDREANAAGLGRNARRRLMARWRQQGRRCWYCPRPATTVDHLIPLVRGGTNYEGNLVPACLACNSRKQDRLPIEFRLGKRASSTYQPFRERPRAEPKPKPVKALAACYICGAMYAVGKNRRTCGGDCAYEHAKRIAREAYRARVGLEPTWHIPAGKAWESKRAA